MYSFGFIFYDNLFNFPIFLIIALEIVTRFIIFLYLVINFSYFQVILSMQDFIHLFDFIIPIN